MFLGIGGNHRINFFFLIKISVVVRMRKKSEQNVRGDFNTINMFCLKKLLEKAQIILLAIMFISFCLITIHTYYIYIYIF